jgi:hypothetical protein
VYPRLKKIDGQNEAGRHRKPNPAPFDEGQTLATNFRKRRLMSGWKRVNEFFLHPHNQTQSEERLLRLDGTSSAQGWAYELFCSDLRAADLVIMLYEIAGENASFGSGLVRHAPILKRGSGRINGSVIQSLH